MRPPRSSAAGLSMELRADRQPATVPARRSEPFRLAFHRLRSFVRESPQDQSIHHDCRKCKRNQQQNCTIAVSTVCDALQLSCARRVATAGALQVNRQTCALWRAEVYIIAKSRERGRDSTRFGGPFQRVWRRHGTHFQRRNRPVRARRCSAIRGVISCESRRRLCKSRVPPPGSGTMRAAADMCIHSAGRFPFHPPASLPACLVASEPRSSKIDCLSPSRSSPPALTP